MEDERIEQVGNKLKNIKQYLFSEDRRIQKELHRLGNCKRNEYTGVLLGKSEIIQNILKRIDD